MEFKEEWTPEQWKSYLDRRVQISIDYNYVIVEGNVIDIIHNTLIPYIKPAGGVTDISLIKGIIDRIEYNQIRRN